MSSLNDQIMIQDMLFFLDQQTSFGEPIVYTAYGLPPITINAVVFRNPASFPNGTDNGQAYDNLEIVIAVKDVPVVNRNGDTVTLPVMIGEAVSTIPITRIVKQDQASWTLGLAGAK